MELGQILIERDFGMVIDYPVSLGNTLSRSELEDICTAAIGQSTPNNNVRFTVHSLDDKWFVVYYFKDFDKFIFERYTAR